MGEEQRSIARLPLFSIQSPETERSGMATPPLETLASVPFRWEQVPGKPRPSTALVPFSNPPDLLPKCLELPPRLLIPSPATVFKVSTNNCYGSDTKLLGAMVLTKANDYCWFGSWRKKAFKLNKREVTGASHVFPSSSLDTDVPNMKRSANSRLWTSICEGLKQVVPWKSKKLKKKNGSGLRF
ncbi:hypothetical protein AAZX31_19G242200 [Glycine max]|uniref:Uncharacterized protein n=2 Tax=Glycine subgen. Soja TaxID=1462606 RepID=C6SV86_SOYBN|nr:uncharacterized protein LOC100305478 [Glycine max]XP_028216987.1 uncharacterized protein At4g00950-like [Glycine soja]ACU13159.1 unknown [Glycine max]KAG4914124.1 hypothetical protein JHK86_054557 [Glycine max]KAG4929025.1 hypothetical protein JHK85_055511 [Glycine max]KAG5084538.1 hypothetical protein JHK84_054576 [Glycine max]KAG5087310.1 hypothetical protein JHK82_054707 [Glycine max]|eukprot:NP_001235964.1 uncharacterized protein LOC100305478 [Glycine max]